MEIEINNQNQEDDRLERVAKQTLREASVFIKKENLISEGCRIDLSVAFLDKKDIAKVNSDYRKIEKPTDVLSFCYQKSKQELSGEILLCWEVIKKNAKKEGIDSEEELKNNLVHGLLHITGFEHSKEMFNLQDRIGKTL